jgi:uncharacterized protein YbjT (DUF2867 family)
MTAASFDRKAIVLGGTGFLGTRVVQELRSHGFTVSIATRFPEKAAQSNDNWENEICLVRIDLSDPCSLELAFKGASAVINCIGFYIESRTESFGDVHVAGARKIAEAAMSKGVQNLIHISGIAAKRDSPSAYVRARADGEEDVRRAFPGATVLRPSVMFSRGGAFFGELNALVRRLPVVPLFGNGNTRLQPVHVGDVASAVSHTLVQVDARGRVYELGGPDVFTYREILQRLARRAGKRRLFLPLPFSLWWSLAAVTRLLPSPPLTPAQVALMQQDNVVGENVATFADLSIAPQSAIALDLV